MKAVHLILLTALTLGAEQPPADAHSRKIANIRKLMTLTGGDKMADQMFDQMAQSLKASGGSDRMLQEFRKEFDFKKLMDIAVAAYDKNLTDEDVLAMIGFYESPAGQRMLQAMPKIVADMMAGSLELTRDMAEKVRKSLGEPHQ
jgi:uncharacterized protein